MHYIQLVWSRDESIPQNCVHCCQSMNTISTWEVGGSSDEERIMAITTRSTIRTAFSTQCKICTRLEWLETALSRDWMKYLEWTWETQTPRFLFFVVICEKLSCHTLNTNAESHQSEKETKAFRSSSKAKSQFVLRLFWYNTWRLSTFAVRSKWVQLSDINLGLVIIQHFLNPCTVAVS